MIQYETKKKSDGMNLCLMGFAHKHKLNPAFDAIKMTGAESWTQKDQETLIYKPDYGDLPRTEENGGVFGFQAGKTLTLHSDVGGKRHQSECMELFDKKSDRYYPKDKDGNRKNILFGHLQIEVLELYRFYPFFFVVFVFRTRL